MRIVTHRGAHHRLSQSTNRARQMNWIRASPCAQGRYGRSIDRDGLRLEHLRTAEAILAGLRVGSRPRLNERSLIPLGPMWDLHER
jgi:hypothetical protein